MARYSALPQLLTLLILCMDRIGPADALAISIRKLNRSIQSGMEQRVAADPTFLTKSMSELVLAAGTQFSAEWNRRGVSSLLPELDFVMAGVLTAMCGKYYTMWRVAPTVVARNNNNKNNNYNNNHGDSIGDETTKNQIHQIPTNAFQSTLLDGVTKPSLRQRILSIFAPMGALFQAGLVASALGYGVTAVLIALRSYLIPTYVAATRNVNIVYASMYTGIFMAVVSNLRYQVLQGLIEPLIIDKLVSREKHPVVHSTVTFLVRMANGFLGSVLAIMGMRMLGLQKLK